MKVVGGKGPDGKPKRPPPGYKGKYEEWADSQGVHSLQAEKESKGSGSKSGSEAASDYSEDDDDSDSSSSDGELPAELADAKGSCGCIWKRIFRAPKATAHAHDTSSSPRHQPLPICL